MNARDINVLGFWQFTNEIEPPFPIDKVTEETHYLGIVEAMEVVRKMRGLVIIEIGQPIFPLSMN